MSYSYSWVGFPMLAAQIETLPRHGENEIGVAIVARPALLGGEAVLEEAELLVEFTQQRNRAPHDLWSPVGGPSASL